MGNESEESLAGKSGSAPRRKANRSNPQVSYAYGAPSDGKKTVKKPRTSKETNLDLATSASPPPAQTTSERLDAAARYKTVKEKQQKRHSTPLNTAGSGNGNVASPRRSTRLSTASSQDGIPAQDRQRAISAIEEDQAVEEEEEQEERASSSASQQRRRRLLSPGQSRGVNAHLSSFYLDAGRDNEDGDGSEGVNGLPTSLLRGSQRPRHDAFSPDLDGPGMTSIRSSDLGDSRSHDYAEEERFAALIDQNRKNISTSEAPTSKWSPKTWFKDKTTLQNGTGGDNIGETSLEKRKRKARVSDDNRLYRPEEEEHSESESETSMEGRKHGHRKKKTNGKNSARGGRDDKKIWMNSSKRRGSKRMSLDGEDGMGPEEEENAVEEEGQQQLEEQQPVTSSKIDTMVEKKKPVKGRRSSVRFSGQESGIPSWAWILGALLLLGLLGLQVRVRHNDNLSYGSISDLKSPHSESKSLSEASRRILKLESAFEALKTAGDNAAKEKSRLAARLTHLETETGKVSQQYTSSHSAMQSQIQAAELESQRIKSEMSKLQSRLESMHSNSQAADSTASNLLKKRLDSLESQMKLNEQHLRQVSEQAKLAERVAAETRKSLEWLEKKLPAEVAVPIQQSSGKPSLDAATWQELRKLFIGKDDLDFERRNEQAIRTISNELLEDKIRTGAILERKTFLDLLESELMKVKADMEQRFNSNAGEIQNEILSKVRSQQKLFEKSGSWQKNQQNSKQDFSQIDIPTKDGSDAKQAIMELIEAALEIYSADRIAKRDFALYSAGARIIPSLTSPTYKLQSKSFFSWANKRAEIARPPVIALHHDTTPGMCWAFEGDDGQLGIGLARKILVSDITLEHIPASISLEVGSSAPRDVTVWGLVERQEDRKRLAAHRLTLQQKSKDVKDLPSPSPPSHNHLLLASFTYDIDSPRALQTFPVSTEASQLEIPISVVQVRVTNNYGNKDFTCLYRVRVHGQEWAGENR